MFRALLRRLGRLAWFLPGFLLWASFPPMEERTDVVFALAPLLWLARSSAPKLSAWRWFANGFLFWFATLAWMPAIVKNGGPWPLVVLGWLLLALYMALYFGAFGWLSSVMWGWTRTRAYGWRLAAILVGEPVLWCGLELVRSRLFGGFAWNQLGVCAVTGGFGAPAALGGVYLCSAVVVLLNGTIAGIAERFIEQWRLRLGREAASAVRVAPWARPLETVLPFLLVFALYRFATPVSPAEPRPLAAALVQRDFPCVFRSDRAEDPVAVYSNLLAQVGSLRPDLVVLSESALGEFGPADGAGAREFAHWAAGLAEARGVLAGGGRRTAEGLEFNSAALFADGTCQIYDKHHLVPFGEFIPGDKVFPALQKLAPVGSCTPGELKLLDFRLADGRIVRLGVAICYEDTDSAQIRRLAAMGADVLVFITNDNWFSHSNEALQHAWQATARAIETGLVVLRVGNGGVTGVVTPDGRARWLLASAGGRPLVDAPGSMYERVKTGAPLRPTFYVRVGDTPLFLLFLLLTGILVLGKKKGN